MPVLSQKKKKDFVKLAKTLMEEEKIQLPLDMIDLKDLKTFYVNMTRGYDNETTYWRGNSNSILEPVRFASQLKRNLSCLVTFAFGGNSSCGKQKAISIWPCVCGIRACA